MEEESKTGWSNTKKLIVSILILLVFFGGALVIGFMISGDIQEVDDRDLMVPEIVVADEDNAYFNLEKALSLYIKQPVKTPKKTSSIFDNYEAEIDNSPEGIKKYLKANEKCLEELFKVLKCNSWKEPENAPNSDEGYYGIRSLNKLLSMYSDSKENLFKKTELAFHLVTLILSNPKYLIDFEFALTLSEKSIIETVQKLNDHDLSKSELIQLSAIINKLRLSFFETGMQLAVKRHYFLIKGQLKELYRDRKEVNDYMPEVKSPYSFAFKLNKTILLGANFSRELLKVKTKADAFSLHKKNMDLLDRLYKTRFKNYFHQNVIGEVLFYESTPQILETVFSYFEFKEKFIALRFQIAVALHQKIHGKYPKSLSDLKGQYLKDLSPDDFDLYKEFTYDSSTGKIEEIQPPPKGPTENKPGGGLFGPTNED